MGGNKRKSKKAAAPNENDSKKSYDPSDEYLELAKQSFMLKHQLNQLKRETAHSNSKLIKDPIL
jgi:hypothetical protein